MMPLPEAWRATSENSVNAKFAERDLELPSIGWQLFILGGSQTDSTAFLSSLDTYDTRLLTEPLTRSWVNNVGCSAEGSKRRTTRAQRRAGQAGYPGTPAPDLPTCSTLGVASRQKDARSFLAARGGAPPRVAACGRRNDARGMVRSDDARRDTTMHINRPVCR